MNSTQTPVSEAVLLLALYEDYIRTANEENRYREGWYPVCINEYQDMEYEAYLSDPDEFGAMLNETTINLLNALSAVELLRLANAYDEYIQTANEVDAYDWEEGHWKPLLLGEFLKGDPNTILKAFEAHCEQEN